MVPNRTIDSAYYIIFNFEIPVDENTKISELADIYPIDKNYEHDYYLRIYNDLLKEKTELGSKIAKRMQLAQKCEDIARAHIEDTGNENFLKEMLVIQPDTEAQIILLSDLYITMRGPKSYKRPMAHSMVLKSFQSDLGNYFDYDLKERFLKFHDEFAEMYNNF
jgi:response regulator RpfG family c-di-GMP phosphodiesterase